VFGGGDDIAGGQDRPRSREYGDTILCWHGYFKVMTRSTPIRSSLKYGVCVLLNLALLGCSGHMLTVNIINHGPPLHSVAIHYPLFGSRTLTADLLPTGGEVSRTIFFRQNGNVWW
jgi:hypothetical protein